MRKKVTCQCKKCKRLFKALSSRAKWCPNEECQDAKLVYMKEKQKEYNRTWYARNVTPRKKAVIAIQKLYNCEGADPQQGQRDMDAHSDSNWTQHRIGSCVECRQKSRLNRFGMCSICYDRINGACDTRIYSVVSS